MSLNFESFLGTYVKNYKINAQQQSGLSRNCMNSKPACTGRILITKVDVKEANRITRD